MDTKRVRSSGCRAEIWIGYAVGSTGEGVAYARVAARGADHLMRLGFRVGKSSPLQRREAAYSAVTAVAKEIRARGVRSVRLHVTDASLVDDVQNRRDLPPAIALANVRLRCALNALDEARLDLVSEGDLTQRARAEVTFSVAA